MEPTVSGIDFPTAIEAHLIFRSDRPARFQRYPGSAWRGAFGGALKRLVCTMRMRPCPHCPLQEVCAFPRLFEPGGFKASGVALARATPAPYVLDPPETPRAGGFEPGQPIPVTLRILGHAERFAGYAALALVQAAASGIGPDRARLSLAQPAEASDLGAHFHPLDLKLPPVPANPVCIRFTTPLRIKQDNDLITPARLRPAHLLGAAVRRMSTVATHHVGKQLTADFLDLRLRSETLDWGSTDLHWWETARRSSRQMTVLKLGGITGSAMLDVSKVESLWPFLWFAQWLHVGKAATMGFGRIRIEHA